MQTIDDLIKGSTGEVKEGSAQDVLIRRSEEIKIKEIERDTQNRAAQNDFPYIDLFAFSIASEALTLIPLEEARLLNTVCFLYNGDQVRIASTNPGDRRVEDLAKRLSEEHYSNCEIYMVSGRSLKYALKLYDSLPKIRKFVSGVEIKEDDFLRFQRFIDDFKTINDKINEVSITDIVTLILAAATKIKSSDIHIEAAESGIDVRFRIDGVLQTIATIDKKKWKRIISRMKLLSGVKINVSNKPQDGRFSIFLSSEKIDVRSSFLPTAYGESVVMRLLFSSAVGMEFSQLGIRDSDREILEGEISKPNGMILITGPTGSGKTTSLYAMLNKLNTNETKIITLENPIEYQLKGINQSQVDEKRGYTFAGGLRSILRQDPDIIMVGEIRDLETAEIATQASLTGHLVLSTLHTNDSSGVIPRLIEMGIKPMFITPSINAVVAQRLVRKLCPECKIEHALSFKEKEQVDKIVSVISPKAEVNVPTTFPTLYRRGKGCSHCSGLGYKGRLGIYEIFTMNDNLKELVSKKASSFKILHQAIEDGMVTMLQDGVLKVFSGITDLSEVYRVVGKFEYVDTLYDLVVSETIRNGLIVDNTNLTKAKELSANLLDTERMLLDSNYQDLLHIIMSLAYYVDAGDVHVEPTETGVKIRFRIDGILHDVANLSRDHYINLIAKIKVTSGIKVNEKKATTDGRFTLRVESKKIDCRLSIISGGYGETVVIRLLSKDASSLNLKDLGMSQHTAKVINRVIKKTKGIIVNTGPTSSGKTTTLYSLLNRLNKSDVKIITIEDPIEYHLDGVMQTQIDTEAGYTFDVAIRSLMRQNPNIIMVGEIRDMDTASAAIEASMTGHLVLSTIHANSAVGAIGRFAGLGIDRQSLVNTVECAIGQRLVRRVCSHCKEEVSLGNEELEEINKALESLANNPEISLPEKISFYRGKGCDNCNGIGYKGRIGIYEIIEMTPKMQKFIQKEGVTEYEIEKEAIANGAITMIQDGVLKALDGLTTISEVLRVVK